MNAAIIERKKCGICVDDHRVSCGSVGIGDGDLDDELLNVPLAARRDDKNRLSGAGAESGENQFFGIRSTVVTTRSYGLVADELMGP